jgi:Holliday junction resolvasome RuvABC endonuclease subunit
MDMPEIFIGIDPSIKHTGYGVIRIVNGSPVLIASDVIMIKPKYKDMRLFFLTRAFTFLDTFRTKTVVAGIERPTYEDSKRGKALRVAHFDKLCLAAGVPIALLSYHGIPWATITASQWKRRFANKLEIRERVERYFPHMKGKWIGDDGDDWEAIGIALWMWKQWGKFKVFEINKLTPKEVEDGYKI